MAYKLPGSEGIIYKERDHCSQYQNQVVYSFLGEDAIWHKEGSQGCQHLSDTQARSKRGTEVRKAFPLEMTLRSGLLSTDR